MLRSQKHLSHLNHKVKRGFFKSVCMMSYTTYIRIKTMSVTESCEVPLPAFYAHLSSRLKWI